MGGKGVSGTAHGRALDEVRMRMGEEAVSTKALTKVEAIDRLAK